MFKIQKKIIRRSFSNYENILVSTKNSTRIIELNRPKFLNALCPPLIEDLNDALKAADKSSEVRSIIITGNKKAFAAGADIKDMLDKKLSEMIMNKYLESWNKISSIQKPIIAAVSGYALGGGFELALMCDIIIATRDAQFGLPELKLGTIPGAGGTQRLLREIGKSKTMEMILTSDFIDAEEALKLGIISKIVEEENVIEGALKICDKINKKSLVSLIQAKDCINKGYETFLKQGLDYEKRVFWSSFGTNDRYEGMKAFIEKRKPEFKDD
jgi:enoyl-CoA hydratase/carnithine racemase